MVERRRPELLHVNVVLTGQLSNGFLHVCFLLGEFLVETDGDFVVVLVLIDQLFESVLGRVAIGE